MVNPVGCIEKNIAVDDCKFGILRWYDLLEFIDELFFIEHVGVGMEGEGRIWELLFPSFEHAFDEEVGDIIIGQAFDDILHIFEYARESGCIIKGEENCDI